MATSATSVRNGGTCRVATLLVLCGLLFFFVSAHEVRGAEVGEDGTAPSAGEEDVKDEDEKGDPQAFFNQFFGLQAEDDGLAAAAGDQQLAKFNKVSDDIEKEWKTYAMAGAGAAGVGGLGALLSHLARAKAEAPLKGKSESERNTIFTESPGVRKKISAAGAVRAVTGALGAAGLIASIYAVTRLLLAKQERRRTQALFEHRKGEWLKELLNKVKEEANMTAKEEGGEDDNA